MFNSGPLYRVFAPQARRIKLKLDPGTTRQPILNVREPSESMNSGAPQISDSLRILREISRILSEADCSAAEIATAERYLMTTIDLDHSREELNYIVQSCNLLACKLHNPDLLSGETTQTDRRKLFFLEVAEEYSIRCDLEVQIAFLQNYGSILIDCGHYTKAEASFSRLIELLRQKIIEVTQNDAMSRHFKLAMVRALKSRMDALILLDRKDWKRQGFQDLVELEALCESLKELPQSLDSVPQTPNIRTSSAIYQPQVARPANQESAYKMVAAEADQISSKVVDRTEQAKFYFEDFWGIKFAVLKERLGRERKVIQ